MSKVGLLTPEEEKFYGKLIAGAVKIKGIFAPVVNWGIPYIVSTLDNKLGDKVPEPWQTHIEKLTSMFFSALQDKHISDEERNHIANYCIVVVNEKIDFSENWTEEQEAVKLISFWKFIATLIWGEVV